MAVEQNLRPITIPASADLSADQYKFVSVDTNGQIVLTAAGAASAGVQQDKPTAQGDAGSVAVVGQVSKVVAGAAFNAGAKLMVDGSGRGITATTGNFVNAIALEAAAGAGSVVSALLVGPYSI